jgi:hypothetical protein
MPQEPTSSSGRGWILVTVVAGLVLLTGIYPLVAEPENRVMAALVIGVAAIALGVSVGPLRRGKAAAWMAMWLFPALLTLMAVVIATTGDGTFGVVYVVFAAVAALGLWLSRTAVSEGRTGTAA